MNHLRFSYLIINLCLSGLFSQSINVKGTIADYESQHPLAGVNIVVGQFGTTSDETGSFFLTVNDGSEISFSFIGYKTITTSIRPQMTILMVPTVLEGEEVTVNATRAIAGVTPVSFSNLTSQEIETRYTVEDVPMILASEPGVWAYSESGNGTGYSYVSIRGFDQSKIGVMVDGVPLNDNESHQVYWVDHGDLLADAKDVQIQRGIGNSLYGSSAFGGSINVNTQIAKDQREIKASFGSGDWNTTKYQVRYRSGKDLSEDLSLTVRASQIKSDGYRENHLSKQKGMFFGLEHRGKKFTNQYRVHIGYENTQLQWDGVHMDDIKDRTKRRAGYQAYTDDFLQQIYSVNTTSRLRESLFFRNVSYLVAGKGYYEVLKTGRDYYAYNLDVNNQFTDVQEQNMNTDLLRRKWIDNNYFGIVPTLTWKNDELRVDVGGEIRSYFGDHFGEVSQFSDANLVATIGDGWYRYYRYVSEKKTITSFSHFVWHPPGQPFTIMADIQNQNHNWTLDQETIGHATGHTLSANWNFFNPRIGMTWEMGDSLHWFVNWAKAQKEPADNQIIEADDVWSKPIMAAAEVITDIEMGIDFTFSKGHARINGYRIQYLNEQLKNIDVKQEGEYDYYSADSTDHSGFEWEATFLLNQKFSFSANGALVMNFFNNGKSIPNIPNTLFNLSLNYRPRNYMLLFAHWKRIGHMYIDKANTETGMIDGYGLLDIGAKYQWRALEVLVKVNNVFDKLYSTYGYGYESNGYQAFFWPGATRNSFVNISYHF